MANANYPPRSLDQATTLFTEDSKIIHDVVNGDATTEVTVDDNNTLPSIRKTLVDNFHFLSPLDWNATGNTEVFNQLFKFTDGLFYYAPTALVGVPVVMGATPVGDPLWVLYSALELKTLRPVAISLNVPLASVGNATAGETLRQYVFDGEITYKVPTGAIGKLISSVVGETLTTTDTLQYLLEKFTTPSFKGNWDTNPDGTPRTGSLSKGATVRHGGSEWELLVDVANITASEPSSGNSDWDKVSGGIVTLFQDLGGVADGITVDWSATGHKLSDFDLIMMRGHTSNGATGGGGHLSTIFESTAMLGGGRTAVGESCRSGSINGYAYIGVDSITETSLVTKVVFSGATYSGSFIGIYGVKL